MWKAEQRLHAYRSSNSPLLTFVIEGKIFQNDPLYLYSMQMDGLRDSKTQIRYPADLDNNKNKFHPPHGTLAKRGNHLLSHSEALKWIS